MMLMAKETIIDLYKKSLEDGDPVRQIKSLAKTNNVKAGVIKDILIGAGLEVPEHIPTGPAKKITQMIEAADPVPGEQGYKERKAAVINEDFEAAVDEMTNKRVVMPDVVKEMVQFGMDALDLKITEYEEEIKSLTEKIEELKEKKRSATEYMKRLI